MNVQKIRKLDFTLLLTLQGLLRHHRTVDVAADLGLSQPAVSHALKRLRDIFGDPLFMRRPHGLEPTQHALALAPVVDSLIRDASRAVGTASTFHPAASARHFRIGLPEHLASLVAAPLLARFARSAPNACFHLHPDIGEEALRSVRRGRVDLALGQFANPDPGLVSEPLYDDRYALVLRRRHPHADRRITRGVLERLDYVAVSPTGHSPPFTDEDFRAVGIDRHIVATVPRFQTAFEVVARTDTAVLAPRRLAEVYVRPFRLVVHDVPIAMRRIHLLLIRRDHPDPGLDWLAGLIHDALVNER